MSNTTWKKRNKTNLSEKEFHDLAKQIPEIWVLVDLIHWFFKIFTFAGKPQKFYHHVVEMDEFSHNHVVDPWHNTYLVYDTSWNGHVTAVAVWAHNPTDDEILNDRIDQGWRPIASNHITGDIIEGFACKLTLTE